MKNNDLFNSKNNICINSQYSNIKKEIIIFSLYKMVSNESSDCFAEDNDINSYPFVSENFNSELFGHAIDNNNPIRENNERQSKSYILFI